MSQLKLGPHTLPGDMQETREWLALKPAVVKFASIDVDWVKWNGDLLRAVPPETTLVLKHADPGNFSFENGDPLDRAQDYVHNILGSLVTAVSGVIPIRDVVFEGLNEVGIMPEEGDRMLKFAAFQAEFARQMNLLGTRAGCGAWATGNPPDPQQFKIWGPVLQACRDWRAVLTRHNYGPLDQYLGLRHRQDEAIFQSLGYSNTPVIISECGTDLCKVPHWGPWKTMWSKLEDYWKAWIVPFMDEIAQDPYIIGATIFTLNDGGGWAGFDIAHQGILDLLRSYPPPAQSSPAPSLPWYQALALPFKCRDNVDTLNIYDRPGGNLQRPATDHRLLDVIDRQDHWLKVYSQPEMWVRAEDCAPL